MTWIKKHEKYLDDPRLVRLKERTQLRWHQLYLLAGRCAANGAFIMQGRRLTDDEIAFHLRVKGDLRLFKSDMKALIAAKLIVVNGHGPVIADWKSDDQLNIEEYRANAAERQRRYREKHMDASRDDNASVTRDTRVSHGHQSPDQSPDQSPESRGDQPTTLPSSHRGSKSGGRAGAHAEPSLAHLKPAERKRAEIVRPILAAAGLRQPKLNTLTVLVAMRSSIRNDDLRRYVLAALGSAYADHKASNKAAIAAHRIEQDQIAPEFRDPKLWKSIPVEVLKAAGIKDLDLYVIDQKYRR